MSAFIISGALKSHKLDSPYDTVGRTPALGIDDGVVAESSASGRVWLSERMDIKQADVILSASARAPRGSSWPPACCPSPHATRSCSPRWAPRCTPAMARGSYSAWDAANRGT